jgi:hypothetical protein
MKLTVPAIRVAEPDPARQEASEHTVLLLASIDALLAETVTSTTVTSTTVTSTMTMTVPAPAPPASCSRPGHHGERGPRRPVPPAA